MWCVVGPAVRGRWMWCVVGPAVCGPGCGVLWGRLYAVLDVVCCRAGCTRSVDVVCCRAGCTRSVDVVCCRAGCMRSWMWCIVGTAVRGPGCGVL